MAQINSNQSPYDRQPKERKLLFASLFTDASVRKEPEEPKKVIAAGLVEATPPPKEYPDTFYGRAFKVFRGELQTLIKACLMFLIFTIPFMVILFWFANYFETLRLGGTYNFMGNIGVGFPGGGDNITQSVATLIWDVKVPVIAMLAGTLILGSLGLSGLFYCAKRSYFQDVYKNSFRMYWVGFAKYWWKFFVTSFAMVCIGLGMVVALMYLLQQQTLGMAGAGAYCAVVFSWVAGLPMLAICVVMMSLFTSYELTYIQCFKNAIVIIANSWFTVIMTCAISAIPLALCAMTGFLPIIIVIAMALLGCMLMALAWIAMGDRGMVKCHNRLVETNKAMHQQQLRAQKEARKQATYTSNAPAKRKPNNQYQNPKKKKKK